MREKLTELLAKVEQATGPDRELDAEIWWHLVADRAATDGDILVNAEEIGVPKMLDRAWGPGWRKRATEPAAVTASVDAGRAAIETMLPKWSRESGCSGFGDPAWCNLWNPLRAPGFGRDIRFAHDSGSEPLAILGSLLKALLAQTETSDDR